MKFIIPILLMLLSLSTYSCVDEIDNTQEMLKEVEIHYQVSSSDVLMTEQGVTESGNAYIQYEVNDEKGFIVDDNNQYRILNYDTNLTIDKLEEQFTFRQSEVIPFVASERYTLPEKVSVVYLGYTEDRNHYWRYRIGYSYGYVVEKAGSLRIQDKIQGL